MVIKNLYTQTKCPLEHDGLIMNFSDHDYYHVNVTIVGIINTATSLLSTFLFFASFPHNLDGSFSLEDKLW